MEHDVAGMINLACSLKHGPNLRIFRQCLRRAIRDKGLKLIEGSPPYAALLHRHRVMKLFLSRRGSAARQVILRYCPNGDWRNHQ